MDLRGRRPQSSTGINRQFMLFDDTYRTIVRPSEGTLQDRGSRFLGSAFPLGSEQEIKDILSRLKQAHPKANHYCWAMRWSTDRSVFRLSDDGEPAGTGGRPILNVLLSRDLSNIALVVVRYFGGTLLGVPGLIAAYRGAAEQALAAAEVRVHTVKDVYQLKVQYPQLDELLRLLRQQQAEVLSQQIDNNCSLTVAIPRAQVNGVMGRLQQLPGVSSRFVCTR